MADITYPDLDPQETDSQLVLKIKEILSIQEATFALTGARAVAAPQDTDSWTQLETKYLESIRAHQAALEAL